MTQESLYCIEDAGRLFNKPGNPKLLKALVRHHNIKHFQTSRGILLDKAGLDALGEAVRLWDSRPRISKPLASTAN